MTAVVISALVCAFSLYLIIGFFLGRKNHSLGDLLPMTPGKQAEVRSSAEFSTSTVATSISLATVVLAFFELAADLGLWLFWTVITTALGLIAVRLAARRIWEKLVSYKHRPTLHEFLGQEYGSERVYLIAAGCTSLGFLGAFAVELTVGTRFLAQLLTDTPIWLLISVLALVGLIYTFYGGFRAVIVTDRIQMASIWVLLAALMIFYFIMFENGSANIGAIPESVRSFGYTNTLPAFLIGIFIINVPTFIADMSVWQRIVATPKPETIYKGLTTSVLFSSLSWGLFVIAACGAFMLVDFNSPVNPLVLLIQTMSSMPGVLGSILIFVIVFGLYGAMLSTASTQLIAVSHTIYEDLVSKNRKESIAERIESSDELRLSRWILLASAGFAILIVAALTVAGFSIADLVFAVYGAQLGLFPPILIALLVKKRSLHGLSRFTSVAIGLGFASGWLSALAGKIMNDGNLVFLAPAVSLTLSALIMLAGLLIKPRVPHDPS
ncbi:MAG: hypothetical protein KDC45_04620 [Bacteroidetes bacterium]|nr:hypothetical protein [Bacteroidota bacterium]